MLKTIFKIIKRIIMSSFILYGFNLIATPLGIIIPINIITVFLITIFGIPALLSFIAIFLIVF